MSRLIDDERKNDRDSNADDDPANDEGQYRGEAAPQTAPFQPIDDW